MKFFWHDMFTFTETDTFKYIYIYGYTRGMQYCCRWQVKCLEVLVVYRWQNARHIYLTQWRFFLWWHKGLVILCYFSLRRPFGSKPRTTIRFIEKISIISNNQYVVELNCLVCPRCLCHTVSSHFFVSTKTAWMEKSKKGQMILSNDCWWWESLLEQCGKKRTEFHYNSFWLKSEQTAYTHTYAHIIYKRMSNWTEWLEE